MGIVNLKKNLGILLMKNIKQPQDRPQFQTIYKRVQWTS